MCLGSRGSRGPSTCIGWTVGTFEAYLGVQVNISRPQVSLGVISLNVYMFTATEVSLFTSGGFGSCQSTYLLKLPATSGPYPWLRWFPDICTTAKIWVPWHTGSQQNQLEHALASCLAQSVKNVLSVISLVFCFSLFLCFSLVSSQFKLAFICSAKVDSGHSRKAFQHLFPFNSTKYYAFVMWNYRILTN